MFFLDEYGRPHDANVMGLIGQHPIIPPLPVEYKDSRSWKWAGFLHDLIKANPLCIGCGREAETGHHDKTFHEYPELELVASNIDLVCLPCHFVLCHAGNWRLIVDNARKRLARNLLDMKKVRTLK